VFRNLLILTLALTAVPAFAEEGAGAAKKPEHIDPAHLPEEDPVVARIGDFELTASAYQRDLAYRWLMFQRARGQQPGDAEPPREFKKQVLEEMVAARLLRLMAENSGIEVTQEEVQQQYEERRAKIPSEEMYRQHLEQLGVSEENIMEEMRAVLLVERYKEQQTADLEATEEEVRETYEKLKDNGNHIRPVQTFDIHHLMTIPESKSDNAWQVARARIEAARERIVEGEPFEDVARDVSQDPASAPRGGLYREASAEIVGPEVATHMVGLEVGELSEPFHSSLGWHVIRVDERNEPGPMSFEEMEEAIRIRMTEQMKARKLQELVEHASKIYNVELMPDRSGN